MFLGYFYTFLIKQKLKIIRKQDGGWQQVSNTMDHKKYTIQILLSMNHPRLY
jgi:hypothetical protein